MSRAAGSEWSRALRQLLLPQFCKICDALLLTEDNHFFCPACWEQSPRIQRPFCSSCGKPHEAALGFGIAQNYPCAGCREKPSKHITRIFGAAIYDGAIEEAIKELKFHRKEQIARTLGEEMREFALREVDVLAYQFIVPVPLHKVRLRTRGYNQSTLLAQEIAPAFPNASVDESLKRIRPTRTQSTLKEGDRRANVRGAFAVEGAPYKGANVLLIDDVVTSAGTVTECAKALKRSGAARVDVFATALAMAFRKNQDRWL